MNAKIQNNILHLRCGNDHELKEASIFIKTNSVSCVVIHDMSQETCKSCVRLGEYVGDDYYQCKVDELVKCKLGHWCGLYKEDKTK